MRAQVAGLDVRSSHDTERNRPVGAANPSSPPSSSSFAFHVSAPTVPLKFSRYDHESAAESHFHSPRHDEACLKRKRTNELDHPGPIRKKRRLRLTLITSRLSLPFAVPTTHIIDRGRSRIAVWAKQKALGRSLLRKAAILNRVTRTVETAIDKSPNMAAGRRGEIEMLRRKGIEITRLARLRGSLATVNSTRPVAIPEVIEGSRAVRPASSMVIESPNFRPSGTSVDSTRKHYAPSPPSPLSQSNSDSLDLEDEEKNEQGRPEHAGAEEDDQDDDAYFDSIIFGVAATSPSTNNSVFVSEYDRLDDLDDDDYFSSIFSSACASPSATTATALTAEEEALAACDDTGSTGTTLFDHLTGISSEDAAPPVAPPPPSQRPKGWNPNFASAPPLPPMSAEGEASQQRKDSKAPEQSSSPSEDDRLAEIMQEKERQRQVLFLGLSPNFDC